MTSLRCALLTPPGRGAIASIAVFGEGSGATIDSLFHSVSGKRISTAAPPSIHYGHWLATGEDVVVSLLEDRIEIHCHGGEAAPAAILRSLAEAGATPLDPAETSLLLSANRWQAETTIALMQAATERTAEILLSQINCGTAQLEQTLTDLRSDDPVVRQHRLSELQKSLTLSSLGIHLTKPWTVVLCGRPNVGKSSLINALVGFERAIVHWEAGTTRDVVTQLTAIEGWPVELKDTAGLRPTNHPIEREGVEFSQFEIRTADLVLAVFDASENQPNPIDWSFVHDIGAHLVVLNKIDLITPPQVFAAITPVGVSHGYCDERKLTTDVLINETSPPGPTTLSTPQLPQPVPVIPTSTLQATGIRELILAIVQTLVPAIPCENQLIPVTEAQITFLATLTGCLEQGDLTQARLMLAAVIATGVSVKSVRAAD